MTEFNALNEIGELAQKNNLQKYLEGKKSLYYLCTRKRQGSRRKRAGRLGAKGLKKTKADKVSQASDCD